jgi:hypothetical protein
MDYRSEGSNTWHYVRNCACNYKAASGHEDRTSVWHGIFYLILFHLRIVTHLIRKVAYRDFSEGTARIQEKPFTNSEANFEAFVKALTAYGGGDGPEDALGALGVAVDWSDWTSRARVRPKISFPLLFPLLLHE